MSVEISEIDPDARGEWNQLVDRADRAKPFHRHEALSVQADYTETELHLLVGREGEEPIGLFPLFEMRKGPVRGVFSPPPYSWVVYLGPVLISDADIKRRTFDARNRAFIEQSLSWVGESIAPQYLQVTTHTEIDIRPFQWAGYSVTPKFTYVVDLEREEDELLASFSGDLRRNIRDSDDAPYSVTEGDSDGIRWIIEQVAARYETTGESYDVDPEYVIALYDELPDGYIRPYICTIDGNRVGGILTVEDESTIYRWQGGFTPDETHDLAVNDVLDWQIIRQARVRGISRYDMVGAGVPRINEYKAKFGPELATHYRVTDGVPGIERLVGIYRRLK